MSKSSYILIFSYTKKLNLSVIQNVIIIFLISILFFSAPELNKYDDAWHSEAEDKNEVKEMGIREREVDEVNEEVEKKEEEESEEITTVKTLKGEEVRMRLQDVPRDGHCLLHAVIVALDDSSDSEPPRLEQLMDYCYETATDNRGRYEMFLLISLF